MNPFNSMVRSASVGLAGLALGAMPGSVFAKDTAVLIGVGKFVTLEGNDLPGIGLDVDMMKGVADRLGYTSVIELRDRAATRRAILDELEQLLVKDAAPTDHVLIYFSGHGTRVDIPDDQGHFETHSAIVAAVAALVSTADGGETLRGVVVGEEFSALFRRARVQSITLVVDACHSGSIDRNIALGHPVLGAVRAVRKFLVWPGMPTAPAPAIDRAVSIGLPKDGAAAAHYVSMAAAGDEESALATDAGSMFTVGVTQAIAKKSADGAISPRETVKLASAYIAREAADASSEVFHPEVHGSDALINSPMKLSDTSSGGGPNWREVLKIAGGLPKLEITGVQARYKSGEEVHLKINLPAQGYLSVLAVGPDDGLTLLFPNQNAPDNHVAAGSITLPADIPKVNGQEIYFPVTAPFGKTLIAAVLTSAPLDLAHSATDAHSGSALYTPSFAALEQLLETGNATRAIALGVRKSVEVSAWATSLEAQTCNAQGC